MDGRGDAERTYSTGVAAGAAWHCGLVALGGCAYLGIWGLEAWPGAALTTAVTGGAMASLSLHLRRGRREARRRRECMRRCLLLLDRISCLIAAIPCRTEAETLAAFHEIRNCYAEAIEMSSGLGDWDEPVAAAMRGNLDQINELYDIQTGSLRRTEANAADFAAAMRALGSEEADGSLRR